ncbi:hypothetical protein [Endozoicomonas sp. ONNA2]|uniref:hypothetical protein n=1 Tax=Endozoicomonas sp. ONNA2 TaxID=2828741 RepID=UPI0021479C56|nr:hypothetical protein [Endozoicomonas sp. ONNA2]
MSERITAWLSILFLFACTVMFKLIDDLWRFYRFLLTQSLWDDFQEVRIFNKEM